MHFSPDDDTQAFLRGLRQMVDDLGGRALARRTMADRQTCGVSPELWTLLGEVGVFGLSVSEDDGGQGGGWYEACLALEVLSKSLVDGPVWAHLTAVDAVARVGSAAQRERWICGLLDGSTRAALWLPGTTATVPFGEGADVLVEVRGEDLRVVTKQPDGTFDGFQSTETMDPTWLSLCAGPSTLCAGQSGSEPSDATGAAESETHDRAVAALSCMQVGVARASVAEAVAYAGQRTQFGRAIGSFQAVQHHCADMFVAAESARSAAWYAAWCCDHRPDERLEAAAVAGSHCADSAFFAASTAVQVYGGIGFTWEHDAHLLFKRAEVTRRLFGGAQQHRGRLATTTGLRAE